MTLEYDPLAPATWSDPYPTYRALRDLKGIHRSSGSGAFCVARYEDALAVLKATDVFSSRAMFTVLMNGGQEGMPPLDYETVRFLVLYALRLRMNPFAFPKARNLISEDGAVHSGLRAVVNRGFTPRQIAALEVRVREIVAESIAALRRDERFDVVHDLAIPLPVRMIAEMIGVEPERMRDFKRWSDAFIEGTTGAARQRGFSREFSNAAIEFLTYLRAVVRRRRAAPGDDLISTILADAPGGTALSDTEAMMFVQLLLVAGNETTTNLIGNAVQALLDHPAELERVRRDPSLLPGLVEETLRFDAPIQTVFRNATRDSEVAGTRIPKGAVVAVMLGSANRDERRFPSPDAFDVTRDSRGHLGFGFGEHFCLGSALARLEGRVALEALVPELGRLERATRERELIDSFLVRGPRSLVLRRAA